jgi:hypothetical protein
MLGTPPRQGYRFRSDDPLQPIASLVVRQDRIALKGGKASWPYTLDEPAQGRIAVRLTLGSGPTVVCRSAGPPRRARSLRGRAGHSPAGDLSRAALSATASAGQRARLTAALR